MPVPSSIDDLSTTAASNSPAGSESPTTTDDYLRAHASFIASLRDGSGFSATGLSEIREAAIVSGSYTATTSGTSVDFTSIPSGVKRITVMLVGVSTNGTSNPLLQIGDSGGIEATGYLCTGVGFQDATLPSATSYTTGFGVPFGAAVNVLSGSIVLTLADSATNTWVASGNIGQTATATFCLTAGSKALSATLDRIRLTTVGGVNTFDAGSVNILYE